MSEAAVAINTGEVAENPGLNPNALEFLLSVYGLDKRLEELTPANAEALAEEVATTYLRHIGCYGDQDAGDVEALAKAPTNGNGTNAEGLAEPQDLVAIVRSFVGGTATEAIAETVPSLSDGIQVKATLNTVVETVKRLDYEGRLEESQQPTLETMLAERTYDCPDFPGPRRSWPVGMTIFGEVEAPTAAETAEQKALYEASINQMAQEAREAVDAYAQDPVYKAAIEQRGHNKGMQTFVVGPEDNSEHSEAIRKMSWLIATAVFAKKDGNSADEMLEHANRKYDYCVLAVNYEDEEPAAVGAIHTKVMSEDSLSSIEDIGLVWDQPVKQTMLNAGLPDLRFEPNVMEISTVAILPEGLGGTAAMALYRQVTELSDALGIEYFVTVLDEYAADQLNRMGNGFEKYASEDAIPPKNYKSNIPDSNKSLPLFCRIANWKARLRQTDPGAYRMMWGNLLTARCQFDRRWLKWEQPYVGKHSALGLDQLVLRPKEDQPVLLMDRGTVGHRLEELNFALPDVTMHYAMKCNSDKALLEYIRDIGGSFEVASFAELQQLIDIGVNPVDVLYSNPVKDVANIQKAYAAGLRRFAFQGINELYKLKEHAPGASVYFRAATGGSSTVASEGKFGQDMQTAEQREEIALLMKMAVQMGLKAYGIGFHVGSQMETPDAWDAALRQVGELMRTLEHYDIKIEMLDIGGGYPAYEHNYGISKLAEFGKVITLGIERYLPYIPEYLAAEPGRALVSDAGVMIAEVIGVEQRNGEWWVYTNVGAFNGSMMEALETSNKLGFGMQDSKRSRIKRTANVTGPSCDSQDTISYGQRLSANLRIGDRVFIRPAGAYTTSYDGSDFNGFKGAKIQYAPLTDHDANYMGHHTKEYIRQQQFAAKKQRERELRPDHLMQR
jgi:ornithine decarboxylase